MKRISRKRLETAARLIIAMALCLMPFLLPEAQAGLKSTTQTVSVSSNDMEADNGIIFDGEGILDAVIAPIPPSAGGDFQDVVSTRSIIIEGDQYECSMEIMTYHYLSQPVTVDDLRPGDYVGFKKDPANMIVELWILAPDQKKSKDQDLQNADPLPVPPAHSGKIRKEGEVWTN